jgi:hypothetical protein
MQLASTARRVAQTLVFRAAVAVIFLAVHLWAIHSFASSRLGLPFNRDAAHAPNFTNPRADLLPQHWDRLVVSRWDTANYIGLMLRGYKYCPARADMRRADLHPFLQYCKVDFYPGFAALGWIVSLGGRYPPDYALFVTSLIASFLVMMMWTSRAVVRALGVWGAYGSLIILNTYTTGFMLATPQTEPSALAFTLGAFLALEHRRFWLGALLAGAASAMRINGSCVSLAYGLALLVEVYRNRPADVPAWLRRGAQALLAGWGQLFLSGYYWYRFHDPLIYSHSHQRAFGHSPTWRSLFYPDWTWIYGSLREWHEVIYLFGMALMFALGHRAATVRFTPPGRVFLYAHFVTTFMVLLYGTADVFYAGTTRYTLVLLGGFFAAAMVLRRRPIALLLVVTANLWHYWYVDMCFYVYHFQPGAFSRCIVR